MVLWNDAYLYPVENEDCVHSRKARLCVWKTQKTVIHQFVHLHEEAKPLILRFEHKITWLVVFYVPASYTVTEIFFQNLPSEGKIVNMNFLLIVFYFIICLLLIICCDWSVHGHMTTLQKWYWGAISLSNTLTQSCRVHVLNSQFQLMIGKPTEVNWDKELRRVWASCKIMIRKGISKTHF